MCYDCRVKIVDFTEVVHKESHTFLPPTCALQVSKLFIGQSLILVLKVHCPGGGMGLKLQELTRPGDAVGVLHRCCKIATGRSSRSWWTERKCSVKFYICFDSHIILARSLIWEKDHFIFWWVICLSLKQKELIIV